MATIDSLHKSLSSMTYEEAHAFIRERRALRRELPPKPLRKSRKTKTSSARKSPIKSIDAALNNMAGREKELLDILLKRNI